LDADPQRFSLAQPPWSIFNQASPEEKKSRENFSAFLWRWFRDSGTIQLVAACASCAYFEFVNC
jgi:hypothetical protein